MFWCRAEARAGADRGCRVWIICAVAMKKSELWRRKNGLPLLCTWLLCINAVPLKTMAFWSAIIPYAHLHCRAIRHDRTAIRLTRVPVTLGPECERHYCRSHSAKTQPAVVCVKVAKTILLSAAMGCLVTTRICALWIFAYEFRLLDG